MDTVRAVGLVVYTYGVLEDHSTQVLRWFEMVEEWSERLFEEYTFVPRSKESCRIWKATPRSREKLNDRLKVERPWYILNYAWPAGTLESRAYKTGGVDVALKSRPQPARGGERHRSPSYASLIVSHHLLDRAGSVDGFLDLAIAAWEAIGGVYGFIDVETGVSPHADLIRTFDHQLTNLIPPRHFSEFKAWQLLRYRLDQRLWKAFWGNLLGREHLIRLGGIEELRRSHPLRRRLSEHELEAEHAARSQLRECRGYHQWRDLEDGGVMLSLSETPLDWYDRKTQRLRRQLDACLKDIELYVDK